MDDVFRQSIINEPSDALSLLAYADWLAEQGRDPDVEFALRWMARHDKRPFQRLRYRSGSSANTGAAVPDKYRWGWYRRGTPGYGTPTFDPAPPGSAWLPRTVFAAIVSSDHQYYPSWGLAVAALALALKQTREDVSL